VNQLEVVVTNQDRASMHTLEVVVTNQGREMKHTLEVVVTNQVRAVRQQEETVIVKGGTMKMAPCRGRWKRKIQMVIVVIQMIPDEEENEEDVLVPDSWNQDLSSRMTMNHGHDSA
jgi:hypothetical protein